MDDNITVIAWEDILAMAGQADHGLDFSYNGIDLLRKSQEERAQALLAKHKLVNKAVEEAIQGIAPLYFRVTAGGKAGTIMRLTNPEVFKRYDRHGQYRAYRNHVLPPVNEKPTLSEDAYDSHGYFHLDGHLYIPGSKDLHFKVDEPDKRFNFDRLSSSNKTMKPELLIGYQGPTVWQYGKPTKKTLTLIDRYGREVGVGDVVLLGQAWNGRLVAGKITRISDARGVWIKHIGSKEDHYEKSCDGDQIMLLKDIEQVLMMEKLKSL